MKFWGFDNFEDFFTYYPFKFNRNWLMKPYFRFLVKEWWLSYTTQPQSYPMQNLIKKLKLKKMEVAKWDKEKKKENVK